MIMGSVLTPQCPPAKKEGQNGIAQYRLFTRKFPLGVDISGIRTVPHDIRNQPSCFDQLSAVGSKPQNDSAK